MSKYESFKRDIDNLIGINLDYYKEGQMKRRIKSLIMQRNYKDFDDFFIALKSDKELLKDFINHLTINVSEFYRNPAQWEMMENKIIPHIIDKNKGQLNIWSSACSTGEEPYSLVMLLSKFFPLSRIKVLATDIDMGAIEKAKVGIYMKKSLSNLPKEFIDKFFKEEKGYYRISDEVKKCVDFKKIDLLKDQFPKNMDLITCRNVMIYFTENAKANLYHKFSESLKPHGIFFVGSTEQIIMPEQYNFKTFETFFYELI